MAIKRFEIIDDNENGSVAICDNSTHPDRDWHEIITIAPAYGSLADRVELAKKIVAILEDEANE
jgi:hypothetical protein